MPILVDLLSAVFSLCFFYTIGTFSLEIFRQFEKLGPFVVVLLVYVSSNIRYLHVTTFIKSPSISVFLFSCRR